MSRKKYEKPDCAAPAMPSAKPVFAAPAMSSAYAGSVSSSSSDSTSIDLSDVQPKSLFNLLKIDPEPVTRKPVQHAVLERGDTFNAKLDLKAKVDLQKSLPPPPRVTEVPFFDNNGSPPYPHDVIDEAEDNRFSVF